jgi:hypothetical protein
MLLDRYLEGQLIGVQNQQIEDHLQSCPACGRMLKASRGFVRLLSDCMDLLSPNEAFLESIYFNVSEAGSTRRGTHTSEPVLREARGFGTRRLRWILVGIAALVVGAAYLLLKADRIPVGTIRDPRGDVMARFASGGGWVPVTDGTPLVRGDRVSLSGRGRVTLALPDRSEVVLTGAEAGAEAELVSEPDGSTGLRLSRGGASCVLGPGPAPFLLDTAVATIRVAREDDAGGRFRATLEGGEAPAELLVEVEKGDLRVSNDRGSVMVSAGKASRTRRGASPGAATDPRLLRDDGRSREPSSPAPRKEVRRDPPAVPVPTPAVPRPAQSLDELLGDLDRVSAPEELVRLVAALGPRLAGAEPESGDRAREALVSLLRSSPEDAVREACVEVLGALAQKGDGDAFEALLDLRLDPSPKVRARILRALVSCRGREELSGVVAGFLRDDPEEEIRRLALQLASQVSGPEMEEAMLEVARDGIRPVELRAQAISSLATYRRKVVVESLMELARDYEPKVAVAAIGALRLLSGRPFVYEVGSQADEKEATLEAIQAWWDEANATFEEEPEAPGGSEDGGP